MNLVLGGCVGFERNIFGCREYEVFVLNQCYMPEVAAVSWIELVSAMHTGSILRVHADDPLNSVHTQSQDVLV